MVWNEPVVVVNCQFYARLTFCLSVNSAIPLERSEQPVIFKLYSKLDSTDPARTISLLSLLHGAYAANYFTDLFGEAV